MDTTLSDRDNGGLMLKGSVRSSSRSDPAVGAKLSAEVREMDSSRAASDSSSGEVGGCSRVSGNSSSKRLIMPLRVLSRKRRRSGSRLGYESQEVKKKQRRGGVSR